MFVVPILKRSFIAASAVAISLGATACDDYGLGPDLVAGLAEFTRDITVSDFESMIDSGTVRIEIHLDRDGIVASRIEVRLDALKCFVCKGLRWRAACFGSRKSQVRILSPRWS